MTKETPIPGNTPGLPEHPDFELLGRHQRIEAYADVLESILDAAECNEHQERQVYAVASGIRTTVREAMGFAEAMEREWKK
ncbi:hypothetical protein [Alkalilacustris brevis]|uniref:hypothetical protein n=1 Tax=Alkalilacustris brevis TaxID=2026338 RepID=UPI0012D2F1D5|nr:hypothetical protein [Alkalilacustris brevis]